MGTTKEFETLHTRQRALENEQIALQEDFKNFINPRWARFSSVGRSVLAKKLGFYWFSKEDQFLGHKIAWLRWRDATPLRASSGGVVLYSHGLATKLPRSKGEFTVPWEYFTMSDRSIGSFVRKQVYAHANYLHRLKVSRSAEEIERLNKEIALKEEEIRGIHNAVRKANENLAKAEAVTGS